MSDPVEVEVYLQIEPEWSLYGDRVVDAKVVRHTRKPPGLPASNVKTVRAILRIPQAAFAELYPTVVVDVPVLDVPTVEADATVTT